MRKKGNKSFEINIFSIYCWIRVVADRWFYTPAFVKNWSNREILQIFDCGPEPLGLLTSYVHVLS
jgi:hypothetical protein